MHVEALSTEAAHWPQILALYQILDRLAPNSVATLNRAVALATVRGPHAGLALGFRAAGRPLHRLSPFVAARNVEIGRTAPISK